MEGDNQGMSHKETKHQLLVCIVTIVGRLITRRIGVGKREEMLEVWK